jgi:MraZ protein
MLSGTFTHSLDDKARVIMPNKFRSEVSERFVITRGFDRCLFVFPYDAWVVMIAQRKRYADLDRHSVAWDRHFVSPAVEVTVDRQGRFVVPEHLREYAGIRNEVVIAGTSNRIELWSREGWRQYSEKVDDDTIFRAVEAIAGLGETGQAPPARSGQ